MPFHKTARVVTLCIAVVAQGRAAGAQSVDNKSAPTAQSVSGAGSEAFASDDVPSPGRSSAGSFAAKRRVVSGALRVFPPLAYWGLSNPTGSRGAAAGLGGIGLGVITADSLWVEGAARSWLGLQGLGWDATLLAGYALGRQVSKGQWDFSIPVSGGYRFAKRPNANASDGHAFTEQLHLVVAQGRVVGTRHYSQMAIELSLGATIGVPVSRQQPDEYWYSDPPTDVWVDGMAGVGVVFGE
jgi:hypothetical protein